MDLNHYLTMFRQAATQLNLDLLETIQIKVAVDIYLESVVLKLYKANWANNPQPPLTSGSRIFFSIWINDQAIEEGKLFYNIHALKLRQLNGHSITSRNFAANFRTRFDAFAVDWPNVSTSFGPQTLMQGWKAINIQSFQNELIELVDSFLKIDCLIDELLLDYNTAKTKQ